MERFQRILSRADERLDEALRLLRSRVRGGTPLDRGLSIARVDFPADRPLPPAVWLAVATVVAIAGSLALDAAIVAGGTALFPTTKGFQHFRFTDYASLTVVGVLAACVGWPVVTVVSSAARWLYLRAAFLVTLVLLAPDVWILLQGESAAAVGVLVVMHLAIALVTYNAVVRIARPRPRETLEDWQSDEQHRAAPDESRSAAG